MRSIPNNVEGVFHLAQYIITVIYTVLGLEDILAAQHL